MKLFGGDNASGNIKTYSGEFVGVLLLPLHFSSSSGHVCT
jgi:hypothetical protein